MKNVHALRKNEKGEFESALMMLPDSVYKQLKWGIYIISNVTPNDSIEFLIEDKPTFFIPSSDIFTKIQMLKQNNQHDLNRLEEGDSIAFGFNYNGGKPTEIIVDKITKVYHDRREVLVHFLYGHHSLAEFVTFDDIIAIGDNKLGDAKIKGWSGKYTVLIPFHPLLEIEK